MGQLVDWDLAAATAGALGKTGPNVSYTEAAEVVAELRRLTDDAAEHVAAFTQLSGPASPVRVVDRKDWASINITGLRQVINPLVSKLTGDRDPGPFINAVGSRVTGMQAGTVLAYLSGKVLGQYEVFSSDPGTLLLVAPNIVEVERKLGADPRDFRLWVALHEVTHRTQFTAVPWLRAHFLSAVRAFVDAAQSPGEQLADRLTSIMTLLEGHAEFVMDGVGPDVVPSVEEIRARFNRRREAANPLERVLRKLLGIEVKLRQYAEGRRFVHGVVDRVGMAGFNRVWESPLTLPYLSELGDPDAWVARVHG